MRGVEPGPEPEPVPASSSEAGTPGTRLLRGEGPDKITYSKREISGLAFRRASETQPYAFPEHHRMDKGDNGQHLCLVFR